MPGGIACWELMTCNQGLVVTVAGKTYAAPTINSYSRGFNAIYQNTTGMSMQLSMTCLVHGSSIGNCTAFVGPTNPPTNAVYKNQNNASTEGTEISVTLVIPPGWYYEVQASGDIYGVGRWWEWSCP